MGLRKMLPVEEIVGRYKNGDTLDGLAADYGVGGSTIRRRILEAGHRTKRLVMPVAMKDGRLNVRDRESKKVLLHRACYEACHGPIPDGFVVHHLNGDNTDNRTENLICLFCGDHTRLHAHIDRERELRMGSFLKERTS